MPPRIRVVVILLASALPLSAQSWDILHGLKSGDRILVVDADGKQHRGAFAVVSNDAITLQTNRVQLAIDRPRVSKVQIRSNQTRVRNILIGAGIGVGVGVTLDLTFGAYFRNETGVSAGTRAITYIAPTALIGGLRSFPAYRTIYRKP